MKLMRIWWPLVVMTFAIPVWSRPFDIDGRAIYVQDGDTLIMLTPTNEQLEIRLSSIDAPESSHTKKQTGRIGQPHSDNSKQYLAALVKGKNVRAHCFESDKYERNVCELFVDGRSVNQAMVQAGWAWANRSARGRYLRDKSLIAIEAQARATHEGLWAGKNPVEPWAWRDVCWKQGMCAQ